MPLFGSIPANQNVEVDPVYVGPSAPAGTPDSGDLWWDTDEPVTHAGEELAYNQITTGVSLVNGSAAQHLVIEGTSRTYDGSPIIVEFYSPIVQAPGGIQLGSYITLLDAGTDLGVIGEVYNNVATYGLAVTVCARRRITPTAGTHNYRIGGWVNGGTGTVYAGPGGGGPTTFPPAYIRVTRA